MEEKAVKAHAQLSDTEKRCKEAERDRKEGSEKVSTVERMGMRMPVEPRMVADRPVASARREESQVDERPVKKIWTMLTVS